MKAVILAGGKGTRLAPLTTVFPKPLLPICGRPILDILIEQLGSYGIDEVILAVGYLSDLIKTYFGNEKYGVKIGYSLEKKPLGTAGPLALVKEKLNEPFLVMNGDVLTTLRFDKLIKKHKKEKCIVTIALKQRKVKIDLGIVEINNKRIVDYIEKPTMNYEVSMGIYVFDPRIFNFIKPKKRLDLPDLIRTLLNKDISVGIYKADEDWLDIGRHDDYKTANEKFKFLRKNLFK